jgi:putative ABC transport system permease protein
VILFGLIEVVLVVGSAFAFGARRQIRELGLLAATGGSPSDVRRALLAQGLVVGVMGSVLGVGAGVGTFFVPPGDPAAILTAATLRSHRLALGRRAPASVIR